MRLQSDFVKLCLAGCDGTLDQEKIEWDNRVALGVVMAAKGYPGDYPKGDVITGIDNANSDDVKVFHAGTGNKNGNVVTSGGRVLCVVALGNTVAEAQAKSYDAVKKIHWDGVYYRSDIGHRAL
jgi:phosphoribosylamine--glycine ligase